MLWEQFSKEMHGSEPGGWMWKKPSDPEQPYYVGYALGYRIVKAYYENADDKGQALREILSVTDYPTSKMDIARPSGTFYIDLNGKTTETKTVKTINEGTKSVPVNCYPVVEFTVYGGNRCQMNYYGKISPG